MKIGVDIRHIMARDLTGVGLYTLKVLENLLKIDSDNTYKLFYNAHKVQAIERLEEFQTLPNVELHGFSLPNKLLNASFKFFNRPRLDKLIKGVDIFWFPNLLFWSTSMSCKTVLTIHDLSFKKMPGLYAKKGRLWHQAVRVQKKLKSADKIIAVSESTKNDLIKLYNLSADKISVIYSAADEQKLDADALNKVREKYDLPEKFILFIGTLEPRKNIEGLIQAFELIDDKEFSLIIAGSPGWMYQDIYKLISKSPKKDKIILTGYIEPASRAGFYQLAGCLVWPSFYEGFGLPPLEAMSLGCPVITSFGSSLPEVVGEAAILVDPYNVREIQEAINQVLANQELRQDLITKGYLQAKKFSWQKTTELTLELLNDEGKIEP